MINLIKNEYIKIIHRSSFYVVLSIIFLFILTTNILYKYVLNDYGEFDSSDNTKEEINYYQELFDNTSAIEDKIYYKTKLDILNLTDKYGINSWQYHYINSDEFYSLVKSNNECIYYKNECSNDLYNTYIDRFNSNDYKSFLKEELSNLESIKESIDDNFLIEDKESYLKDIDNKIMILNYRIDNSVSYENNYLNDAVSEYYNTLNITDSSIKEEHLLYLSYKEDNAINKYIMDTKENINKINDSRGILLNLFSEYEILIILSILLLCGSIISIEYNKGTIKQLLLTPYKREEILLAKVLTSISMIFVSFIIIVILQLIVGTIFFGIDSLSIPAVVYDFNLNKVVTYNVFKYLLMLFINKLPMYILFTMMVLFINTLFNNNAITMILSLIIYIANPILNTFATNIKLINYFITPHWDLSIYLFGKTLTNEYLNMTTSIITCIVYFISFTLTIFMIFRKKDIKNT